MSIGFQWDSVCVSIAVFHTYQTYMVRRIGILKRTGQAQQGSLQVKSMILISPPTFKTNLDCKLCISLLPASDFHCSRNIAPPPPAFTP